MRKEIHLTPAMAKALEKEAKSLNTNLKSHIEDMLDTHVKEKKVENGKSKQGVA